MAGADFLAALVASCFLGALPPVDLRAVCLVRAIGTDEVLHGNGDLEINFCMYRLRRDVCEVIAVVINKEGGSGRDEIFGGDLNFWDWGRI